MKKSKKHGQDLDLKLFVSGASPNSVRAINNIQKTLNTYVPGKYNLSIIDIYQDKTIAELEQIIAVPLLIRKSPLPEKRFIGDLSDTNKLLKGLEIITGSIEDEI
jgi:circadian clock protein KaiB